MLSITSPPVDLPLLLENVVIFLLTTELKLAAMFSEDDLWYRAEVLACYLSSSPAYVTVLYLDYGNTENVGLMK